MPHAVEANHPADERDDGVGGVPRTLRDAHENVGYGHYRAANKGRSGASHTGKTTNNGGDHGLGRVDNGTKYRPTDLHGHTNRSRDTSQPAGNSPQTAQQAARAGCTTKPRQSLSDRSRSNAQRRTESTNSLLACVRD